MGYGKKDGPAKTTRIEYRASPADAELLEKIATTLGMDKAAVIRLAVRRLAMALEKQGWPIQFFNKGKDGGTEP